MKKAGKKVSPHVVECRGVALEELGGAAGCAWDWKLKAGELAHIGMPDRGAQLPFGDLIHGIVPPPAGEIFFRGRDWNSLSIRKTENARLTIGRVFDTRSLKACWIQNLVVAENVILSQCFRPKNRQSLVLERAEKLAVEFGLSAIPTSRPAVTPSGELAISQWIRAFLPDPLRLLILEYPTSQAPDSAIPALFSSVARARENGTAVVWIGRVASAPEVKKLSPEHTFIQTPRGILEPT